MLEYKGAMRKMDGVSGNQLEPLPTNRVPVELHAPARGLFPSIERSLKGLKASVPQDWKVENMLTASAVATTSILRLEKGLAADVSPKDVLLILDQSYRGKNQHTGKMEYGQVDYEVRYEDGTSWRGTMRMPHFNREHDDIAGIPLQIDDIPDDMLPEHTEVFGEKNMVDKEMRQLTPLGLRMMVSHMAATIYTYNEVRQYQRKVPQRKVA